MQIYTKSSSKNIKKRVGAGLVSGPTFIILGRYFKKKRLPVNLIVMASGSFGGVIFPPLCQSLINTYSVKGALIVLGGMLMNVLVSGALMRPIEFYKPKIKRKEQKQQDSVLKPLINENMDGLPPRSFSLSDSTYSPLARRAMLYRMRSRTITESSNNTPQSVDDGALLSIKKPPEKDLFSIQHTGLESIEDIRSKKRRKTDLPLYSCHGDMINIALSDIKFRKKLKSQTNEYSSKIFENGYSKEDISKSKSSKIDENFEENCCKQMFDTKVFKNRTFSILFCVTLLSYTALNYPIIYLPLLATDIGHKGQFLSVLVTISSATDCACRICFSIVSVKKYVIPSNVLIVLSLICTGMLNCLTSLYSEYWMLVLYSIIHGFFCAVMFCVCFGNFCIHVGHKMYIQGFSIFMLCHGILQMLFALVFGLSSLCCWSGKAKTAISHNISQYFSLLRDITRSYETSFYLIGAFLLTSAVLYSLAEFSSFLRKKKRNTNAKYENELSELNVPVVYHSRRRRSNDCLRKKEYCLKHRIIELCVINN
ncbi:hypothetical protein KUTeg_012159 [Tegillarca granosa]|uniref:Uncharacterized protein n=1 Tax=Tegillarca granosa TaxID=220873 RepID=A0ABQ9EYQ5_TEGGR|nr:hypothetical protein KUTeg_012159 [Tegillarca granosa]